MKQKKQNKPDDLQCIKNLLILQLIKDGSTSEEISIALKAGQVSPSNIRVAFPMKKMRGKNDKKEQVKILKAL